MSASFDIRVVATDGKVAKKILWVKRTSRHIVYGWDIHDTGYFTYHESGKLHFKHKNKIVGGETQKIPLIKFKGRTQVGHGGFNKNLSGLPNVDFDFKKVNGLVWIDTRTITSKNDSIGIDLQLIEADRLDLTHRWPNHKSLHVFTSITPWVVVTTE